MSAKWRRVKQWDDRVFPAWAWPFKAILRAFSSIWLAVILLVGISIYAVFASVPIGLLALIPTMLVYGLTLVAVAGVVASGLVILARAVTGRSGRDLRFILSVVAGLLGLAVGAYLWYAYAWPPLHYDPATGSGVRFFSDFVESYKATTVRRLPGFEMTELEFYSWWPMRAMLLAFVLNMVVATLRRIEFTFPNIGVLTVHAGIITIALGSVYYQALKREGDTILPAGVTDARGNPAAGPAMRAYDDREAVALWISQFRGWEQRPLSGVPRYNEYGLDAGAEQSVRRLAGSSVMGVDGRLGESAAAGRSRTLDKPVPDARGHSERALVDPDLRFRLVGYAPYADPLTDWVPSDPPARGDASPLRMVYLRSTVPTDAPADPASLAPSAQEGPGDRVFYFALSPTSPADRVSDFDQVSVEYTIGMDEQRWADLTADVEVGSQHALIVEVGGLRMVGGVSPGSTMNANGWRLEVEELLPEPPFPIVTEGFRGATSPVAIVRVTPPEGSGKTPFSRWVYHRFPGINQDLSDEVGATGMPARSDPDPDIRIAYLDLRGLHVYFDEDPETGLVRAAARGPTGVRVVEGLGAGDILRDAVPLSPFELGERFEHAAIVERPSPVVDAERQSDRAGTHEKAMLAVEITSESLPGWSAVRWLPFARTMTLSGLRSEFSRRVELPDGRVLDLAFSRVQRMFPDFALRLVDFQMIAYDHRGAPRDYQSIVSVEPIPLMDGTLPFEPYTHVVKLNAPLKAPFHWQASDASVLEKTWLNLSSHLNPSQFKLSQAGWDAEGWRESQALADQGLADRPRAAFTILGVGNNPGIHVIAFGGVLMGVGIPWAFYVKPWLIRRKKKAIQRELAQAAKAQADTPTTNPRGASASKPIGATP